MNKRVQPADNRMRKLSVAMMQVLSVGVAAGVAVAASGSAAPADTGVAGAGTCRGDDVRNTSRSAISSGEICSANDSGMIDCGTTLIVLMSARLTVVVTPGPCLNVMLVGDCSPITPTSGSPDVRSTAYVS